MQVLIDHLDDPYSKCIPDLQDQVQLDAYAEIRGTNYSTPVSRYCESS